MTRTPRHIALQREYWPYHCKGFLTYLGRWSQEDFDKQSPGCGREWFGNPYAAQQRSWEGNSREWLEGDLGWSYIYRCQAFSEHRGFVDSA